MFVQSDSIQRTELPRQFRRLPLLGTGCILAVLPALLSGCVDKSIELTEVKRIDEKVTEPELMTFLAIISHLPNNTVPQLPPLFAPPPEWSQDRTLPVDELVIEEQRLMEGRQSVEWMAARLHRNRSLQRVLRRRHMTPEQFVGLVVSIGVALSRNTLRDDQQLEELLKRGELALDDLRQNTHRFSSLRPDERHRVLQQAMWITRLDRAHRLQMVPPENMALAQEHQDVLSRVLPAEFLQNPLDAVADLLQEQGIPFEDISDARGDTHITWTREAAIYGTDPSDPEMSDVRRRDVASGSAELD
jgi:hypothetical protein